MLGCPGSGKSSWVKEQGIPSISRDDIRIELGYCGPDEKFLGTWEQENKVTEVYQNKLKTLANAGENIALDNTNLNKKYRTADIKKLRDLGYHVIGVKVVTSLETCKSRRSEQIPENVVTRMYGQMTNIDPSEFDEFLEVAGE